MRAWALPTTHPLTRRQEEGGHGRGRRTRSTSASGEVVGGDIAVVMEQGDGVWPAQAGAHTAGARWGDHILSSPDEGVVWAVEQCDM
jgi:hypothetical protein